MADNWGINWSMSGSDTYKYKHGEKTLWETKQFVMLGIFLVLAVLMLYLFGFTAIVGIIFLFVVMSKFIFGTGEHLELAPRYLLVGSKIIYFRNVKEVRLDEQRGTLTLTFGQGRAIGKWTLERELFPTNARKEHKIALNKSQKFQKVSQKIIGAVRAQAPQAVVNA